MPARLILNADDFGLTPGINRAVLDLHRAGVLTSATLIATAPAFNNAVVLAKSAPALGVGCHLLFVDGVPVSHPESIPSLLGADGKTFRPSIFDFAQAVLRGTVRQADLARETQAQIQKLQRAGVDVTHVDTHKHTHVFPLVAETVLHIAERCGVPALRNPFEPRWAESLDLGVPLMRKLQLNLLRRFKPAFDRGTQSAADHGFIPYGTLGISSTGSLSIPHLRTLLRAILSERGEGIFELCCHPGYLDAELQAAPTRLRSSRELERKALLAVIPEILQHPFAPELIHYGDLGVPGLQRASGQFSPHTGFERVL